MTGAAASDRWGIASETGVLTDVLLCRPEHYRWIPTNVVAEATLATGRQADPKLVSASYGELVAALEQSGVTCHYLTPDPHLPYQVYTRDSSQMTPKGLAITRLQRVERQAEWASVIACTRALDMPVPFIATAGSIEGGDIHLIKPGLAVIGVSGGRTGPAGAAQFKAWLELQGWEVRLEPFAEHFLHFDLLFDMVADGLALCCHEVVEPEFLAWLDHHGIRTIPVPYRDAMQLGCNVLALGGDRVISPVGNVEVNRSLRAEGLTVLDPDLAVFTAGGGGAHCMTMPLKR